VSISTARRRPRPEVMSPVDGVTMVSLFVFQRHFPSILCRFDVITAFRHAETGEMTISAARGVLEPEMTSPFDSFTLNLL
jgi:hypothetical protein